MSVFKCKMCGGTLEINNETVAVCEYCGTKQTLPKLSDEHKANLYDRANHFRRNNEFDKAMGIYEQILNDDNTDAESYWSLVLCRFGIEYVEDPATRKRIPTVNRAQFTSVFDDEDYKSALRYADGLQREIYEAEATAINEIQKGILAISGREKPFDVFICYKETDTNGRRTPDSVLATELYHELTREGFKVFFSRITLEDKLGQEYEPYIFAALNSAKVMVVVGTKPEHFNAVWVRNEWSRYLALIKNGARKIIIPAYKDMDPYDLPEEFSHLQAQDMSKLGFMQDLIRGIGKFVEPAPQEQRERKTATANEPVNANISVLLKRAFIAVEDGEWRKADKFCEQILAIVPECAEAYLIKLMTDMKVNKREQLENATKLFDKNGNYKKAVRFGDKKLEEICKRNIEKINTAKAKKKKKRIKLAKIIIPSVAVALAAAVFLTFFNFNMWTDIIAVETGGVHTVGLKSDGTVVAVGANDLGQCNVEDWKDIIAISAGVVHTAGLKKDGTVITVGRNNDNQCNVEDWRDIIDISVGEYHTVGLKSDGTVVAVGDNDLGQCNVEDWKDVISISAGWYYTVGLKSDGTVVAAGDNGYGQCNVEGWKDIISVSAGCNHTVGLKSNGTVVSVGSSGYGKRGIDKWFDIMSVSAGKEHTLGIKKDGTVVAVGGDNAGSKEEIDISNWKDIVSVTAGHGLSVGIRKNGTVVAVGDNGYGQCNIGRWKN